MRFPLLVLIAIYSIVLVGLTLMPGHIDDATGEVQYIDLFHAFYFVSFMGTTIGFGEIPQPFSAAQRLWVTFSIYLTVIAWVYAIGTLIALFQNKSLQRSLREMHFTSKVKNICCPFYLICGYGETGRALVATLEARGIRVVVIEQSEDVANTLIMENYPIDVPLLCADSRKPLYLQEAGLNNPHCQSVIAVTNNDSINLQIAITSKLLNPKVQVICRTGSQEVAANMKSFGTDYIMNPFEVFAAGLHTTLCVPHLYLLREWFTGCIQNINYTLEQPPFKGLWILCSYGRFGKAVYQRLKKEPGLHIIIIEAKPELTGYPEVEYVIGQGTEASTLQEAHIEQAVGIIAGTNNDVNNLSIVMTARELSKTVGHKLFVVLRQNQTDNHDIFQAVGANVIMPGNQAIADYIRVVLTTPMLVDFMKLAKKQGDDWAKTLLDTIHSFADRDFLEHSPEIWETCIDARQSPSVHLALQQESNIYLGDLLRNPRAREQKLSIIPLLLLREHQYTLLPDEDEALHSGDQILWCGSHAARWWSEWAHKDHWILDYLITGTLKSRGTVMCWLNKYAKKQGISP
ncbi:potassium channel family protein [Candidatus Venteria ishoeyi]|uniref:Voltage-gated potassium channel Kch n=1 Tax=Candidatus Venteria ishoeyi TaxID=1899563 RepID=A0A1H6F2M2_9GAMM|nr:NAD(P)-binding protein [Candidatus Venteria ishoeyi]MDM8546210.1 NAD-binding protein [Candidatus Venteria ishoeyi]SEH04370.1 Voltage-gated potassium channel Kch [Candidatus Venteria ishoeyi]